MDTLLKERIEKLGIKQQQLADRLGISKTYTSRILNNKRPLSYKLACKLAKELKYNSPIEVILAQNNIEKNCKDTKLSELDKTIEEMICSYISLKFEDNIFKEQKLLIVDNIFNFI